MPRTKLKLTTKQEEARESMYSDVEDMIAIKEKTYPQLTSEDGDRTPKSYWDDSDRRLNGYTLSKEEQGKDDWQANLFNPNTRSKLKAIVAGVALQVPDLKYQAVNKDGLFSTKRAEVMKQLVRHSRLTDNPQTDIFFEAWEAAGKGTVVKYDGYLRTKYKRKFIKSYDIATGEVEFDEREEIVDDRPIDIQVPLQEFFWWDMTIFDVQDQPKLCWIQHYDESQLEQEFGQYANFKYVKDGESIKKFQSSTESYFYEKWGSRIKAINDFEVIRYFNKLDDRYEIWVNGVPLLLAPLVWGKARKRYPFSKTIFEPFEGKSFFLGKSFPSVIEGIQDVDNTVLNSILDKLFRSLEPPMLVGLANKDLLDVEDELVNQDNKIYVPDINQVKPMPFAGVNQGDIAMLDLVSKLGDSASIDTAQQGVAQKDVTARATIIADENARKLKGIFFMFLEDLWIQKTKIRILNITMNYTQPKLERVVGKDGQEVMREALNILNVNDVEMSDGTTGTLGIQIAQNKKGQLSTTEIEAREEVMNEEGFNYKLIAITSDWLDNWDFDFQVISRSIYNQDRIRKGDEVMEKVERIAGLFPERFIPNKDKLFGEVVDIYGESAEEYEEAVEPQPEEQGEEKPLLGL